MDYDSFEAQLELVEKARRGEEEASTILYHQVEKLISHHASMARRGTNVPFEDIYQEGVVGYLVALQKYDPASKVKFTTYAATVIKNTCIDFIDKEVGCNYRTRKRKKVLTEMREQGASDEEIRDALGVSDREFKFITSRPSVTSLNAPIDVDDEKLELGDSVPADIPGIEDDMIRSEAMSIFLKGLDKLTEMERAVFLCNGAFGAEPKTREEIKQEFGISNIKFNNVRERAVLKMKSYVAKNHLEYTDLV